MAISPLSGAAGLPAISPAPRESFGKVMKAQVEHAAQPVRQEPVTQARSTPHAKAGPCRVEGAAPSSELGATKVLAQVNQAQQRMEQILHLAESGKSFSPAELLSLQTHVYRASQELDLAGKVVEKATGGVKQVLQTQV